MRSPRLTIHDVFAAHAAQRPGAVAVQLGTDALTYGELDERTDVLASHLTSRGVRPGDRVAIFFDRSVEMIVALLGTLKAAGAYVTLDRQDPPERLATLIDQAKPCYVLTQHRLAHELPVTGSEVICLDDWTAIAARRDVPPRAEADPEQLAYICFTSGSTGTPKGVCVPHRAVVRLAQPGPCWEFTAADSFLQVAPLAFDASVFEIWACLLNGARLVMYPPLPPTPERLGQIIAGQNVTVTLLATGLFHRMVDCELDSMRGVRHVLTGGDVLSPDHANRFRCALPHVRLTNGYGVAEATSLSCCYDIDQPLPRDQAVPIGRPVPGTRAYVLDSEGNPAGPGERGELYLAGDGLSAGYFGQPELTARTFLTDPFCPDPGALMYRTGDTVSLREDNVIVFGGRTDAQVKVRGFRVELGEIETTLTAHPSVRQAIAVTRDRGADLLDRQIVGYVAAHPAPGLISELRALAGARLPAYMVPSVIVRVDEFPLTGNGKVARDRLPAPPYRRPREAPSAYVAPRTPTEFLITDIVESLLGIERVSVEDEFFAIGGNSLLAADTATRMQRALGLPRPLERVFARWTVADLASAADKARPAPAQPPPT